MALLAQPPIGALNLRVKIWTHLDKKNSIEWPSRTVPGVRKELSRGGHLEAAHPAAARHGHHDVQAEARPQEHDDQGGEVPLRRVRQGRAGLPQRPRVSRQDAPPDARGALPEGPRGQRGPAASGRGS